MAAREEFICFCDGFYHPQFVSTASPREDKNETGNISCSEMTVAARETERVFELLGKFCFCLGRESNKLGAIYSFFLPKIASRGKHT